jgi:hypothetical protein
MTGLADADNLERSQVYGLYVIGEGSVGTVAQTVFGSQYRDRMRIITASRLLDLLEIQQNSGPRHTQVVDVLLPVNAVDVGQFVGLIQDVIEFRDEGEIGDEPTTGGGTTTTGWDGPQTGADAIQGTVSRAELDGDSGATVAVFPSQTSGIEFLQENNAWGFVRISQQPDWVAIS